jgi:hypothetical protein
MEGTFVPKMITDESPQSIELLYLDNGPLLPLGWWDLRPDPLIFFEQNCSS